MSCDFNSAIVIVQLLYNDYDVTICSYSLVCAGDVVDVCDSCLELSGNLFTSLHKMVPSSSSDTTGHVCTLTQTQSL
jgi:hypothetical protein